MDTIPVLPLVRLRLQYRLRDPLPRAALQGSLWRGVFGYALKETLCLWELPFEFPCAGCIFLANCTYPEMFEPRPGASTRALSSDDAPRPFVLEPPVDATQPLNAGEGISIGLVLMGPALRDLPTLIRVAARLGERGLGEARARAALMAVEAAGPARPVALWPQPAPAPLPVVGAADIARWAQALPETLTLRFLTPTRLKREKRIVERPDAETLFRALLRRVMTLAALYGEPWYPATEEVIAAARRIPVRLDTGWQSASHRSSRQERRIPLDGFVGALTMHEVPAPLRALLALGSLVHIGGKATYGHGWYTLDA